MIILGNIKNTSNNMVYGYAAPEVTTAQHTYTYAPGIATYGIQGILGKSGNNGNTVFITDYILDSDKNMAVLSRITSSKSLLTWNNDVCIRPYLNGDIIIDANKQIYEIKNINLLVLYIRNIKPTTKKINLDLFFTYKGKLPDNVSIFNDSRIRTTKTVITDIDIDSKVYQNTLLTLISSPDNNITDFIDLNTIYSGIPPVNFSIYYNKNTDGFHIDSNYPIYIDAPVSVKYTNGNIKTDEYSPILTTENSITTYVSKCKDTSAEITSEVFKYNKPNDSLEYYGCLYTISLNISEGLFSNYSENTITIHYQNGNYNDFQPYIKSINVYRFIQKYDYVKPNEVIKEVKNTIDNILISLIYNLEVFLKITKRELPKNVMQTY